MKIINSSNLFTNKEIVILLDNSDQILKDISHIILKDIINEKKLIFEFNNFQRIIIEPYTLDAGFYQIDLFKKNLKISQTSILVQSEFKKKSSLFIVSSQCTWLAYNNYRGNSNYYLHSSFIKKKIREFFDKFLEISGIEIPNFLVEFLARKIKKDRFNGRIAKDLKDFLDEKCDSHLAAAEICLVKNFHEEFQDCSYISDATDFSKFPLNNIPRLVLIAAHSEYWTDSFRNWLAYLIKKGVNIIFLSGNNGYRKVSFKNNLMYVNQQRCKFSSDNSFATFSGCFFDKKAYGLYKSAKIISKEIRDFLKINTIGEDVKECWKKPIGHEVDKVIPFYKDKVEKYAFSSFGSSEVYVTNLKHKDTNSNVISFNSISICSSIKYSKSTKEFIRYLINKFI